MGDHELNPRPSTFVWSMPPAITRADIPVLCDQLAALLREHADARIVVCDLRAVVAPDTVMIEALARFKLTAVRLGRHFYLDHASGELKSLLALTGLDDLLPLYRDLRLQPRRQAEQREDAIGVEERVEPCDPAV